MEDGWEVTCHIGLTKYPGPDYSCLELKQPPKNADWYANDVKHWCSNDQPTITTTTTTTTQTKSLA
jgi:hypothetical protein